MKWEEAMQELNKIIPQTERTFKLGVCQYWLNDGPERDARWSEPDVTLEIEGAGSSWNQFTALTFAELVDKIRRVYGLAEENPTTSLPPPVELPFTITVDELKAPEDTEPF